MTNPNFVIASFSSDILSITTTRCAWHSPLFLAWRSVWPGLLVPSPKLEACGTYLWLTHWTSPKINDITILIYQVTVSAFIVVWKMIQSHTQTQLFAIYRKMRALKDKWVLQLQWKWNKNNYWLYCNLLLQSLTKILVFLVITARSEQCKYYMHFWNWMLV